MAPTDSLANKTPLSSSGQGRTTPEQGGLVSRLKSKHTEGILRSRMMEYCLPIQLSLVRATEPIEMAPEVSILEKL